MRPKNRPSGLDLFRARLDSILNLEHELCVLAQEIDWSVFDDEFLPLYADGVGRPGKSIRLMVGIHYLKHAFNESDETVVARLLENPYWQYFCGFDYFQHEIPVDSTTLVKWRKRVGAEKMATLLAETVATAKRSGQTKPSTFQRVNVDTTVQEKAIAFPTDARLYHKARERLVKEAKARGMTLRQTYVRIGMRALVKHHRYCHAKQFKRARKPLRKMKTYLGRVVRDIERQVHADDADLLALLAIANRILEQQRTSKNKVYSVHEPDVACIAKGKAHRRYEFGCKVGVVSTSKDNWVVAAQAYPGNPYDGHTLSKALEEMERITGEVPEIAYVDKGYRGHRLEGPTEVHIAGTRMKRGVTRAERKRRKRRSAVEPIIGHMKEDNRLGRNYLKGIAGDEINAILAGCGYNIRKLLRGIVSRLLVWMMVRPGSRTAWA